MSSTSDENQEYIFVSRLLIYYIRMYCESFDWLTANNKKKDGWDFQRNAYLEVHLLYSRVLIEFITGTQQYPTDRFAVSFFCKGNYKFPKQSETLKKYSDIISKRLAHITLNTVPFGQIKSNQEYKIHEIAQELIPNLQEFFSSVPENRVDMKVKEDALQILGRYSTFQTSITVSPST